MAGCQKSEFQKRRVSVSMRFDVPVYFQRIQPGEYEESSGDYGPDGVSEDMRYGNVTDVGTDTLNLVYGEIRQGCKVIRLQTYYDKVFDRIRIGERVYRVDLSRRLRVKQVLIVSEVQGCR